MAYPESGDEDVAMVELGLDSPVLGTVHIVNGDQVDVIDPDGDVDCWPVEWLRERP